MNRSMYPEPFVHLRAALRREYCPDSRDLTWLTQNLGYLEQLNDDEKMAAQRWLREAAAEPLQPKSTASPASDRLHPGGSNS